MEKISKKEIPKHLFSQSLITSRVPNNQFLTIDFSLDARIISVIRA